MVLVGIPGAGKSAAGALVADALGVPLVEVDDLVEAEFGAPATEVFATEGEAGYRATEERMALTALAGEGVVALSSGAVTSAVVRDALAGLPVVWLRAPVATVTRRLGMNSVGMAALVAIRNRMDAMLAERAPLYASVATAVVDTERLTASEVASAVLAGARSEP